MPTAIEPGQKKKSTSILDAIGTAASVVNTAKSAADFSKRLTTPDKTEDMTPDPVTKTDSRNTTLQSDPRGGTLTAAFLRRGKKLGA